MIVSYDFADDKVRAKFSKFLKKFGHRMQYSVFEIKNSDRIVENIKQEIEHKYKQKFTNEDSIWIFTTCEACNKKIVRYGYAKNEESDIVFM